jgi:hypothetical protein
LYDELINIVDCQGFVLENAIDSVWFSEYLQILPDHQNRVGKMFVGWAGGRRPEADLVEMSEAWGCIAKEQKYDHVHFVVGGWEPDVIYRNVPYDRIIRKPWTILEEWPAVMQVDVGCCALASTSFNACKSDIKWQEFTLAGAPVVVSPTVYTEQVVNNYHGLVATTTDEWYEYNNSAAR